MNVDIMAGFLEKWAVDWKKQMILYFKTYYSYVKILDITRIQKGCKSNLK